MLNADTKPARATDIRFRRILDEAVVIKQASAEALVINEVAAEFLQHCDGEHTIAEIAGLLADQFDAPAEVIQRDIISFGQELLDAGLIEITAVSS